ncbi:MAG TPA: flagellar filament capping protein FliD [Steroidobacteraceae bacterium]|nr:flagellar filament capping protein FliD [Steroidobacteraceae bacterium]
MSTVNSTTSPVSIASSSSAAAAGGSVIDVNSLVSQLVAATRAPQDSVIASKTQAVTTQITALGTLKGALSTFQTALAALDTPSAFNAETANTSDSSIFTATASTDAVAGTYSVSVSQLAQAQQLVSKAFPNDGTAPFGTGTLKISLGAANFSVTVNSTNDTLSGLAAAINSAAGNPGVTATVLSGTDGDHLVLSSTLTGASNSIQVSETDAGTGLAGVTYATGNTANYTQNSAAQDAKFSISGIAYTSPSNTVSNALSGVTLNLTGTTAAGTGAGSFATLKVAQDTSTIETNIGNFVSAYNTLVGSIQQLSSYDSTTNTAGPMLGDALLTGIRNQIRSALYSIVNNGTSTYNSLASIGITTRSDGTLSLNSTTLQTALSAAPGAVSSLFSGTHGIATNLNSQLTTDLASGGSIDSRSKTLVSQENALTDQTNELNKQMAALTASMTQQYATLNTLLSSLQSTSAYLTQQFAALPQVQQKQ